MIKQIKILSKLELINMFSLNVIIHTKDKKAKMKSIVMGIVIGILLIMAMGYVGTLSYGFFKLGVGEIVPSYIVFLSSIFTLLFCAFKAGKIIFKESCYDILASMPVKKSALVMSRYVILYAEGLVVACVVMLPGIVIYTCMAKPGIVAVIFGILSVLVVPVIPVALSVLLGVIITGISSRMKNKALFEAMFFIVFMVGFLALTAQIPTDESSFDLQNMKDVAKSLHGIIHNIYPPATWFAGAIGGGNVLGFVLVTVVSTLLLFIVITVTTINFEKINRRIHTSTASHDYKLGELSRKSMMKAIVLREAKRYFSSGTYVTNTIVGPVMAVVFAVSMFFVDINDIFKALPVGINVNGVIPVLFAGILVMNGPISTSVSMEGKEFWIIRTLPVSDKDILKSKMIFSMVLLAPFYVVGEIIMIIAIKPEIFELVWMMVLPLVITFCALAIGLAANLKFPKLKWSSDIEVVKQSASAMIGGFGGLLVAIVVAVPLMIVPIKFYNLVVCGVCVILITITAWINDKNSKFDFRHIG